MTPEELETARRWMEASWELTQECFRHKAEIKMLKEAVTQAHSMMSGIDWSECQDLNGGKFPMARIQEVYTILNKARGV